MIRVFNANMPTATRLTAIFVFSSALATATPVRGQVANPPRSSQSLVVDGYNDLSRGDLPKALADFHGAYVVDSVANAGRADGYALVLSAFTLRLEGKVDSATAQYERAVSAIERNIEQTSVASASEPAGSQLPGPEQLELGLALSELGAIVRERGLLDSAGRLFRRADDEFAKNKYFDFAHTVAIGVPAAAAREHAHLQYVCVAATSPTWCKVGADPIAQLRLRAAKDRFVGDIDDEARTLTKLADVLATIGDTAGVRSTNAEIPRLLRLVGGTATAGSASPDVRMAPPVFADYVAIADSILATGHADSLLRGFEAEERPSVEVRDVQAALARARKHAALLFAMNRGAEATAILLTARNGVTLFDRRNDIPQRLEYAFLLADLAALYHRGLSHPNLGLATAYYDSASTEALNVLDTHLADEQRTSLTERMATMHGDWALAWLARGSGATQAQADSSVRAALGAVEEGRARALDFARGLGDRAAYGDVSGADRIATQLATLGIQHRRDFITGEFTIAGPSLGQLIMSPIENGPSALLDYLIVRDTLVIWSLVENTGIHVYRAKISVDSMRADIDVVRASMERPNAPVRPGSVAEVATDAAARGPHSRKHAPSDVDAAITRLYAALLPPDVRTLLEGRVEVAVVPDGMLTELPFAVLRPDTSATPLALEHTLRFAPAVTLFGGWFGALGASMPNEMHPCTEGDSFAQCNTLALDPPRDSIERQRRWDAMRAVRLRWSLGSLVVGDPRLAPVRRVDDGTLVTFESLPGARAEAESIAKVLGVSPILGADATRARVRALMPSARIIHLATHGIAYSDPHFSRRSFVAFSDDSLGRGTLEAGEILADSTLRLRADLVVLSACQTALGGATRVEGTIGLQRAFLARGARSLLVSQWSVPDPATAMLMEAFYAAWFDPTGDGDKAAALRTAQVKVRSVPAYRDPYYWAAFQLVGAP
jgi:tetratricopeptide (TPR) repeat protein